MENKENYGEFAKWYTEHEAEIIEMAEINGMEWAAKFIYFSGFVARETQLEVTARAQENLTTTKARWLISDLRSDGFDDEQILNAMLDGAYLGKSGISAAVSEEVVRLLNNEIKAEDYGIKRSIK